MIENLAFVEMKTSLNESALSFLTFSITFDFQMSNGKSSSDFSSPFAMEIGESKVKSLFGMFYTGWPRKKTQNGKLPAICGCNN